MQETHRAQCPLVFSSDFLLREIRQQYHVVHSMMAVINIPASDNFSDIQNDSTVQVSVSQRDRIEPRV